MEILATCSWNEMRVSEFSFFGQIIPLTITSGYVKKVSMYT